MIRQAFVFAAVFLIRAYQALIRPLLSGSCKFCPSCSEYGIEALQRFGLLRGIALTARRLIRCHPFSTGGIDPVPTDHSIPNSVDSRVARNSNAHSRQTS